MKKDVRTHEKIDSMKSQLLSNLSQSQRNKLDAFLKHDAAYFVFPSLISDPSSASLKYLSAVAELKLFAIRDILGGYETAFVSENEGELIREVTPKEKSQIGSQGERLLPYHTDMGYLRFPNEQDHPNETCAPDFLILTCIQNDEKIGTSLLDLDRIKSLMKNNYSDLFQDGFAFISPDSVNPQLEYKDRPIAFKDTNEIDLFRWEKCTISQDAYKNSYDRLKSLLQNFTYCDHIVLTPGETLVFNNRRCVHGRPEIPPNISNRGRRMLYRLYVNHMETPINPAFPEENLRWYLQKG